MMKNKYIILLGVFLIVLTSCNDFIEIDNRGEQDLDNYFSTQEECETYVNGLYRSFSYYNDWWQQYLFIANNMASDDAWMGNLEQDATGLTRLAHYTIEASSVPDELTNQYVHDYYHINNCNIAIQRIAEAPIGDEDKAQLISEAKFFRAFSYWELVQNFGDVVLMTQTEGTSNLNKNRNPKADVYAQVVKDLQEAAAVLPASYSNDNLGKITKYACHALLSRTYLYMKEYQKAYAHADTVIREGGYSLQPNFVDIWSVYNHNGPESIFEIQTSADQEYGVGNMFSIVMNARGEQWTQEQVDEGYSMGGWGWCVPSSHLEQAYVSEGDDIRRKSTIIKYGEAVYGDEELNPEYKFNINANKSGRTWRKFYVPIAMRKTLENIDGHVPLPFVLIRLGEMYLNRAEAAYFLNNENQAHADLKTLRARVELGDKDNLTGNDLLYAIWKERRLEMACEGQRLFDLRREIDPVANKPMIDLAMGTNGYFVRYNLEESTDEYETIHPIESQDKGTFFVEGRHELWPIPQSEIDRSNGVITQNPNY